MGHTSKLIIIIVIIVVVDNLHCLLGKLVFRLGALLLLLFCRTGFAALGLILLVGKSNGFAYHAQKHA